jgi:hypothetical protein
VGTENLSRAMSLICLLVLGGGLLPRKLACASEFD